MVRRKFLQLVALSGAGALAPLGAIAANPATSEANAKGKTAVYQVKGFTYITCAVGLDTMFSRSRGIISSHSTYPQGKVTVRFDPASIDAAAVRAVITDAGFTVASEQIA